MNKQSENDVVSCPYNKSHKVVRSRLLWHIQKCKSPQTIKNQFGHCKYNYLHIVEKTALSMHEDCECVDRPRIVERRDDCGEEGLKEQAFKEWKKQQNKEKKGKKLNNVHEAPGDNENEPLDYEVASILSQSQVDQSSQSVVQNIDQSRLDSTLAVDQSQSELNLTWLKNNDNKAKKGYKPTNLLENRVKEEEELDSDQQEDSDEDEIEARKVEEIKKKRQKEIENEQKKQALQDKALNPFCKDTSQDLSFQVGFRSSLKKKQPSTPSDSHDSDEEKDLSFENHSKKNNKRKSSGSSKNSSNSSEENKDASDDDVDSECSFDKKPEKKQDKLSSSNPDSDSDNVVDSDDEEAIEEQKQSFDNSYVSRNNQSAIVEVEQSFDAISQMQKSFCQNKDGKDRHFHPAENSHHTSKKSLNESRQLADVSLDNQSFQSKSNVHEHPQKHQQKQQQTRLEKLQQEEEEKNKAEQPKYRRKFVNPHNLCEEDSKRINELQADLDATLNNPTVPGTRGQRPERPQNFKQNNYYDQRGNQRGQRDNNQQGNQRGNRDRDDNWQGNQRGNRGGNWQGNQRGNRDDDVQAQRRDDNNNQDNWPVIGNEETNNSQSINSFQQDRREPVQDGGRNNQRSKRNNKN